MVSPAVPDFPDLLPSSDSHLSSTLPQVLSPLAAGLFHRAIAQSGIITIPGLLNPDPWLLAQVCISFTLSPHVHLALCLLLESQGGGVTSSQLLAGREGHTRLKEAHNQ